MRTALLQHEALGFLSNVLVMFMHGISAATVPIVPPFSHIFDQFKVANAPHSRRTFSARSYPPILLQPVGLKMDAVWLSSSSRHFQLFNPTFRLRVPTYLFVLIALDPPLTSCCFVFLLCLRIYPICSSSCMNFSSSHLHWRVSFPTPKHELFRCLH